MRYAIALASLIMAATAQAQAIPPPRPDNLIPPPQYDHTYRGMLTMEHAATAEELQLRCPQRALACAFPRGDQCHVLLSPESVIAQWPSIIVERIVRHEIAHCNGWPGNHPGANTTIVPKTR